jgi:hypothetical protein
MFLRAYHLASILWLQYVVHVMLFPMIKVLYSYINTFCSILPVPTVAAFCSTLMSCFLHMLLRYFVNNFEMVPVAYIITCITSVLNSTYAVFLFKIFSASFLIMFLSPDFALCC